MAWWAQKLYSIWSRLYAFVVARWPFSNIVEGTEAVPVEKRKSARRQAAVETRNDVKLFLLVNS